MKEIISVWLFIAAIFYAAYTLKRSSCDSIGIELGYKTTYSYKTGCIYIDKDGNKFKSVTKVIENK